MNSRRETLIQLAGVAGVAASAGAQVNSHKHADATTQQPGDRPLVDPKKPRQTQFFNKEEFEMLETLVDLIIPRTDTPGAKDAGVADLIDERVPRVERIRSHWREGLAHLNRTAQSKFGAHFTKLSADQQTELLTAASKEHGTPARRFFELVKGATVDGYYETKEGLADELGWHGNVALTEFTGCTHPEHQA